MGTNSVKSISIIVPVLNGMRTLGALFDGIALQNYPVMEVLLLDSESNDGLDKFVLRWISRGMRIRILPVKREQFSHGPTRNFGARNASGEILVFMTQDAEPLGPRWLSSLVAPFDSPVVACVFSRHTARPYADPVTKSGIDELFDGMARGKDNYTSMNKDIDPEEYSRRPVRYWFNSDVCSAIRASVYDQIPFKDVPYAEDQIIGRDIIEAGYTKVFANNSIVIHSHKYSLAGLFKRYFDDNRGLRMTTGFYSRISGVSFFPRMLSGTIHAIKRMYLKREPCLAFWCFYALAYNAATVAGYTAGQFYALMPPRLQSALSAEGRAYNRKGCRIDTRTRRVGTSGRTRV
jgi:rhamnosyltransferase